MSYEFTKAPFKWTSAGSLPTESEITLGLQGGSALPAAFVNAQWTNTYDCIIELQDIVGSIGDGLFTAESLNVGTASTSNTINSPETANSAAIGDGNTMTAMYSAAIGNDNEIYGFQCTALGNLNAVGSSSDAAYNSVAGGDNNVVSGHSASAIGTSLTANNMNHVVGKFNKVPTAASTSGTDGDIFIVGNGTGTSALSNAFRVTAAGQCMGTTFFASSGADYAELFEWADGNPEKEDRRGLFVTLDGEKIRLATVDDEYILGAISGAPTVIGDAATEDWHGKYKRDVFGARIVKDGSYQLSETFDKEHEGNYINRLERPEWGIVGLTGKLVVVDNGTCKVNGYCSPTAGGIATASEKGYRVMSRVDDTHIRVLVK